ncbi:apolipoprotein D [Anopheles darlingi]|uniref:Apolipoprotein D n=1 Tax=Anopheles darlingi TaxID=43151 RepID=W5JF21_ANODA|nr:apolipoprotein D [Anopheles darlingi]
MVFKLRCVLAVAVAIVSLLCLSGTVQGHTYKTGECPTVEPMSGFQMKQSEERDGAVTTLTRQSSSSFLGIWYVIQKTGTASTCVIYNITKNVETPDEYFIEQVSQKAPLSLAPIKHEYSYTGKLTVTDRDVPARMTVRFPLSKYRRPAVLDGVASVAGSAKFVVFMTDYDTYAGVFSCQKIPFGHRQSATLLSRTRDLDKIYVDKVGTWSAKAFAYVIIDSIDSESIKNLFNMIRRPLKNILKYSNLTYALEIPSSRRLPKQITLGCDATCCTPEIRSRLAGFSVDPFDLSIVNQTGCPKEGEAGWNIHIDPDTFSTRNIANAFRKAGEAIGDGFEAAVNAGKKLYNKYRESDEDYAIVEETTNPNRAERLVNQAEWLP